MRSKIAAALLIGALLPQCMRVSDGIEVDVSYQPAATPSQIRTDLGYRIALNRALLVVGQIELIRCDNFVAEVWQLFAPARARAHVLEKPTRLGEPLILDLMESVGLAEYAGTMKPPPGRYCGVRLTAMPADADAVGLTDKTREMTSHSLLVEGRLAGDANDGTSFQTALEGPLVLEIEFERPLVLDRPGVEPVAVRIDQRRWFDGIDFAALSPVEMQRGVAENLQRSLEVELADWKDGS